MVLQLRTDDIVCAQIEQGAGELFPDRTEDARCDGAETVEHLEQSDKR